MKLSVKNLAIIVMGIGLMSPAFVFAVPAMPHQFYGSVNFDNGPAPDGLLVEAKVDGVSIGSTLTKNGKYGYDPLFKVEYNNSTTTSFYVAGVNTGETAIFSNGASTNRNLTVPGKIGSITKNEGDVIENETVTVASTSPMSIKMGGSLNVTISSSASTSANVEKIEKLTSGFFTGTKAVIAGNRLLNAYEIKITGDSLNINITMNYDPTGIDENTVKPYYYNGTEWVLISGYTRDTVNHAISYTISAAHTPYAIFGQPPVQQTSSNPGGGGGSTSVTVTPTTAKKGDANGDNKVDKYDFSLMMANWGKTGANVCDFNNDGKVDKYDFSLLMLNWSI